MQTLAAVAALLAAPFVTCTVPEEGAPAVEVRAASAPAPAPARTPFDQAHTLLDELLRAHVQGDRLDYEGVRGERAKLDRYLAALHAVTPAELEGWTREQRFAFWINVYNAHVIQLVLDHYPLESIKDLGGLFRQVWDREFIPMNAHHPKGDDDKLSLDDVEHGILRVRFEDARLHAAVNCASVSCPPLLAGAFTAERLDEQLEGQMRAFLADPTRNRFDDEKKVVHLSKIFDWFEEDFERDAGSVRDYVARFAPADGAELVSDARLSYLPYDWSLNDVAEKP